MLQCGQAAPDFSLYDSDKIKVTLSEQQGSNVLLLFYPLAFTSTCSAELCTIRDNLHQYNKLNVKVFGISVDSLYTLAKYKEAQNLNFTLLSDFNKEVSKAYDSLYETFSYNMKGVSKRSAFLIDNTGIIRFSQILENASEQPDFELIKKKLMEIYL
jgi:peroxiredoxin